MIILLSGSINSGKTTVSRRLVQMLPQTAHVEIDDLREFIRFMPLEAATPLCLQNAVAVTRNLVAYGFNVILSWPLPQESYDYLIRELQPLGVPLHCITLSPELSVALTNRGTRDLTEWEMRRIPYLYETGISHPLFGSVVDNTHQTPDETAREIIELLGKKNDATQ